MKAVLCDICYEQINDGEARYICCQKEVNGHIENLWEKEICPSCEDKIRHIKE